MSPSSTLTRPCSMMYPYLPSAPIHCDEIERDTFPGGRKCEDDSCTTCVWLNEGPNFQSSATRKKYKFMTPATCSDLSVIYLVTCVKCGKQYVGYAEEFETETNGAQAGYRTSDNFGWATFC